MRIRVDIVTVILLSFACNEKSSFDTVEQDAKSPEASPVLSSAEATVVKPPPSKNSDPIISAHNSLRCLTPKQSLSAKQSFTFAFESVDGFSNPTIKLLADDRNGLGSLDMDPVKPGVWTYRSPDRIPNAQDIEIQLTLNGISASCRVRLIADEDLGTADDGETNGLVGLVYPLPANTQQLPNFAAISSSSQIVVSNLDIPNRSFDAGFPGVAQLFEWFAIRFRGMINVPSPAVLRISSDDGSVVSINDQKWIDNDGVHAIRTVTASQPLAAGQHAITIDYFQGPRYSIALQLFWDLGQGFVAVPPAAFTRPNER